jgi:uncharacterized protein YneF (UPF0154 family)
MARSRRKRKDVLDKTTGVILLLVGVALVAGLVGGAWWLKKTTIQVDAENCPLGGPHAIHMIMIDRSDPISGQQAQRVRQYIKKIKDEAFFGTRFDVYVFEGDIKNELHPILRVCAPGRPENANELIENPEFIRRRYADFSATLDQTIDSLMTAATRPNSPIIESLRAAALSSFGPEDVQKVPLKATLVSDMVQNTGAVSHYRGSPDFAALSQTMAWATLKPALHGAEVIVLYLLRPNAIRGHAPIQNRGHEQFWEQLILASGGRPMGIEPI